MKLKWNRIEAQLKPSQLVKHMRKPVNCALHFARNPSDRWHCVYFLKEYFRTVSLPLVFWHGRNNTHLSFWFWLRSSVEMRNEFPRYFLMIGLSVCHFDSINATIQSESIGLSGTIWSGYETFTIMPYITHLNWCIKLHIFS